MLSALDSLSDPLIGGQHVCKHVQAARALIVWRMLSRPDSRLLCMFLFFSLVRVWCGWVFYVVGLGFLFLCVWPGTVLNQRQLSIVVSDWEPYLSSLLSHFELWVIIFHFSVFTIRDCFGFLLFFCSFVFSVQFIKGIMNTYHTALWSTPSSTNGNRYTTIILCS